MQRIEIRNLGPIKNIDMDVNDFNLIIGEQATGKSTIAKAVYYFRYIKTILTDYLCQLYDAGTYNDKEVNGGFEKSVRKELKYTFVSLFGYSWDLDKNLSLKYYYTADRWISIKLAGKASKRYISLGFSAELKNLIHNQEKEALSLHGQKASEAGVSLAYASKERLRNYDNFKKNVNYIFDDDRETYYIPAGRSMITLLVNNRSLIESNNLDFITRQFMQIIDNIHGSFSKGIKNAHKFYPDGERKFDVSKVANTLVSDLKGDYQFASGKEYILLSDKNGENDRIPINFASSGQQEVLWLLNQLYILMLKREKAFVIIEEPEAHLYPSLQNRVVEFISYFMNVNDSSVFITTHSPYILTSVNALYCGGKLIEEKPQLTEKVRKIVGPNCEIMPQKVTALKLARSGAVEDLIDHDMGELGTDMIDEISDGINSKYTGLYYLDSTEG